MQPRLDSATGFQPNELGPLVRRRPYLHLTRLQTLLIKWALILATAPLAAGLVQLVAGSVLSMPTPHPWHLWAFSTSVIAAIGVAALATFALFGSVGPLANMIFFVALAMTSSAGAVPLEAVPPFFRVISHFEPMRPIVKGLRSILYFDEAGDSGLGGAWLGVLAVAIVAILAGVIFTRIFDRVPTLTRHPEPPAAIGSSTAKHRAPQSRRRTTDILRPGSGRVEGHHPAPGPRSGPPLVKSGPASGRTPV
jgi:hypothetical protein